MSKWNNVFRHFYKLITNEKLKCLESISIPGYPMPCTEQHLLMGKKNTEYPFEHGEVINYTSDGVSIHPVTTKIQASFLTQLPERM